MSGEVVHIDAEFSRGDFIKQVLLQVLGKLAITVHSTGEVDQGSLSGVV